MTNGWFWKTLSLMRRLFAGGGASKPKSDHYKQAERADVRMEARQGQDNGEHRRA
jgi:hypothetical protein